MDFRVAARMFLFFTCRLFIAVSDEKKKEDACLLKGSKQVHLRKCLKGTPHGIYKGQVFACH
jgi:hypothetical protein